MEKTEFRKTLWDLGRTLLSDITAMLEPFAQEYGLTMLQLRLLLEIQAEGNSTVGSLTHIMGENSGNCSSACKRLEAAGFLIRRRCPADERRVELILTDKSRELLDKIAVNAETSSLALAQEIPEAELEEIFLGMQRLSDAIHLLSQKTAKEQKGKL